MKTRLLKRVSVVFLAVLVLLSSMSLSSLMTVRADDTQPEVTTEVTAETPEEPAVTEVEPSVDPGYVDDTQEFFDVTETVDETVPETPEETVDETTEAATEEETTKTEVAYPAAEFSGAAGGVEVYVAADEGTFPEGTTMTVIGVSAAQVYDTVNAVTEGEVAQVKAVDITFYGPDGQEVQPKKAVHMTMNVPGMAQDADIVHIADNGAADVIQNASISGDNASVEANSFSIYAVVVTGTDARLKVNFVGLNGAEIASMYVKENDNMEQVLYDPGAGELGEGVYFRGWTDDPNYTTATTAKTITEVRTEVADNLPPASDGTEVTYYAMLFKDYRITYLDENDISLGQEEVTFRADAASAEQSYTVNMAYTVQDDTHHFEGWNVVEGGNKISGYTEGKKYENKDVITITGDVTFGVNAPAGHWFVFDENGKGATYNAPQFVYSSEKPTRPDDTKMIRNGYTFGGWFATKEEADQESGGTEYDFDQTLTDKTEVYARWISKKSANYTVLVWKQRIDASGYDFEEAITLSGTVGENVNAVSQQGSGNNAYARIDGTNYRYTGFHLKEFDQAVEIKTEGNSVVNVYYDRTEYSLTFQVRQGNRWNTVKTITARYQESIANQFPITVGSTVYADAWVPQNSQIYTSGSVGALDVMPAENTVFHAAGYNGYQTYTLRYYVEALPTDTNTVTFQGKEFVLYTSWSINYGGWYDNLISTKSEDFMPLVGFEEFASNPAYGPNGQSYFDQNNNFSFYYLRKTYPINFMDGAYVNGDGAPLTEPGMGQIGTETGITYGADTSTYNSHKPDAAHTPNGYVFEGWYMDSACTQPYTFTRMPEGGITVYAKWRQKQYRVFLHPNYPEDATGTIDWGTNRQDMTFRVSEGGTVSEPTGRLDGYEFVGWYLDPACSQVFNGDAYIINEFNVTTPYDKTVDMTVTYDNNGNLINPKFNSDATGYEGGDRFWITKKLDIYAKWRSTLDGASGIVVEYDANGGTGAPADTHTYVDGALAPAGAASKSSDSKKVFGYWEVQKWENGAWTGTGTKVVPGKTFAVLKTNAKVEDIPNPQPGGDTKKYTVQLKAVYIDSEQPTPTHIYWYKNDGSAAFQKDEDLAINAGVDIPDAPTRDGHEFLGWARVDIKVNGSTDNVTLEQALAWETTEANYTQNDATEYLFYDGSAYHLNSTTGTTVTQVAADEDHPYQAMFAVWKIKKFTVTWKSQDGTTTYETDTEVPYGTAVSFDGTEPTKADDAQYTYTFAGWATEANQESGKQVSELPAVSGDATYYAAFSKTPRTHTVTWKSQDGETTYETDTDATHGSRPSFDGTEPTKPADAQYTYTFAGWATEANQETGKTVAELPDVTDDAVYYAAFSKETNKYTVIWKSQDGATTYETDTEDYGAAVSFDGTEPTKEADAQFTYTFEGWATESGQETGKQVSELPTVSGNVTYYASFSKTTNTYTVTWKSQDGSETYETDTDVPYGTAVSFDGTEPTKPADVQYTYTFAGWATSANAESGTAVANLPAVSGDATYYAAFSKVTNKYTVTYQYGGNVPEGAPDVPEPKEYEYGATVPKAAAPSVDGYTFSGWQGEPDTMPGNNVTVFGYWEAQVTAEVTATPKTVTYNGTEQTTTDADYTITYKVGGKAVAELPGIIVATIEVEHAKGTDAGNYTGEVSVQLQLMQRAMGYDVDSEVKKATLSLTINKAPLTITTPSATKVADGTPLTAGPATITGLVNGETATVTVTGRQIAVGSSQNTCSPEITWGNGGKEANYAITRTLGTLTVTAPATPDPGPGPGPGPGPVVPVVVPDGPAPAAPVVVPDNPTPQVEPTTPAEIDNDPTPKANTKTWALLNLILSAITVILAIVMIITFATGSKDDEDDEENQDGENKKHRNGLKFLGLIPAVGTVVLFFLTEDLTAKMALTDKWTILTAVITVIGIVLTIVIKNKKKNNEEETPEA